MMRKINRFRKRDRKQVLKMGNTKWPELYLTYSITQRRPLKQDNLYFDDETILVWHQENVEDISLS